MQVMVRVLKAEDDGAVYLYTHRVDAANVIRKMFVLEVVEPASNGTYNHFEYPWNRVVSISWSSEH